MDEPVEFVEADAGWLAAERRVIELAGRPIEDLTDEDVVALKPQLTEPEWDGIAERRLSLGFERATGREPCTGLRDILGRRPRALRDLSGAADSLGLLIFCAGEWMSEAEWRALVRELRPLLQAAAALFEAQAVRNADRLAALSDRRTDFVVATSLADLRTALTACAPGLHAPAEGGRRGEP